MKVLILVILGVLVSYTQSLRLTTDSEEHQLSKLSKFRKEELKVENMFRRKHHVPDLVLDSKLNRKAQKWAKYLAKNDKFEHSKEKYGENLYMSIHGKKSSIAAGKASQKWYAEIKDWDFNRSKSKGGVTGHFTQLVWKNSKKVGFGKAKRKVPGKNQVKEYVVAMYDPPGNFKGRYAQNVLPI